jgi:hypothetical protein
MGCSNRSGSLVSNGLLIIARARSNSVGLLSVWGSLTVFGLLSRSGLARVAGGLLSIGDRKPLSQICDNRNDDLPQARSLYRGLLFVA